MHKIWLVIGILFVPTIAAHNVQTTNYLEWSQHLLEAQGNAATHPNATTQNVQTPHNWISLGGNSTLRIQFQAEILGDALGARNWQPRWTFDGQILPGGAGCQMVFDLIAGQTSWIHLYAQLDCKISNFVGTGTHGIQMVNDAGGTPPTINFRIHYQLIQREKVTFTQPDTHNEIFGHNATMVSQHNIQGLFLHNVTGQAGANITAIEGLLLTKFSEPISDSIDNTTIIFFSLILLILGIIWAEIQKAVVWYLLPIFTLLTIILGLWNELAEFRGVLVLGVMALGFRAYLIGSAENES